MHKNKPKSGLLNVCGSLIREYRILKGYSQKDLSDRLELVEVYLHKNQISRIEAGERSISDYELLSIARALGTTPNKLLELDD